MEHAHHTWLSAIADDVQNEYDMVRRSLAGPEKAQQRGHHYEALFRRLLLGWLPPQYQIGTRNYLLLEREVDGRNYSRETDLVIYHPSYPRELRERSEVLVSGVVAAFSVKSELEAEDLNEAIAEARLVREGIADRANAVVGELVSPLIYGLLAHTHKLPGAEPRAVVSNALLAEAEKDEHPRRQLDIVCIADLDCWYRTASITQQVLGSTETEHDVYADYWHSAYEPTEISTQPPGNPNPVATLVTQLWAKLATRDPQLIQIAHGLQKTETGSYGGPGRARPLAPLVSQHLHKRLFEEATHREIV